MRTLGKIRAMIRPAAVATLLVAVVGGFLIGRLGELETVLLGGLGYLVSQAVAWGSPGQARRGLAWQARGGLAWQAIGCLVLGGAVGLVVARVPFEPSVSLAARSVVFNPVILAGFVAGARLSWLRLHWAEQPDAPSAASRPAPRPARTRPAGSP